MLASRTQSKLCLKCGYTKNYTSFSKRSRSADGRNSYCKECDAISIAHYRSQEEPSSRWRLDISDAAIKAIHKGIEEDHTVAMLEALGLTIRTINALEESRYKIIYLKDLLARTQAELKKINTIGGVGLQSIRNCLMNYDKLP